MALPIQFDVNQEMDEVLYKYSSLKRAIKAMRKGKPVNERIAIADLFDYATTIAEEAQIMAEQLGYTGPGIFDLPDDDEEDAA